MASYHPQGRHNGRPWKARVKRDGIEYFLGYFYTRSAAEEAELRFAYRYHSRRGKYRNG